MRAGGSPPATPGALRTSSATVPKPFNEGRGFTPGDTPAARSLTGLLRVFNEGRGFTPGDTIKDIVVAIKNAICSMRAGGSPPATPAN